MMEPTECRWVAPLDEEDREYFSYFRTRRSDSFATKRNLVEILRFTLFSRHVVFDGEGDKLRNKRIENHITVSVVIDMECGNTKN